MDKSALREVAASLDWLNWHSNKEDFEMRSKARVQVRSNAAYAATGWFLLGVTLFLFGLMTWTKLIAPTQYGT